MKDHESVIKQIEKVESLKETVIPSEVEESSPEPQQDLSTHSVRSRWQEEWGNSEALSPPDKYMDSREAEGDTDEVRGGSGWWDENTEMTITIDPDHIDRLHRF